MSVLLTGVLQASDDKITISGTVTNKDGVPVDKCDVFFNADAWTTKNSIHVVCDESGKYTATLPPGHYNSVYICDEEKYGKTALEFWG